MRDERLIFLSHVRVLEAPAEFGDGEERRGEEIGEERRWRFANSSSGPKIKAIAMALFKRSVRISILTLTKANVDVSMFGNIAHSLSLSRSCLVGCRRR